MPETPQESRAKQYRAYHKDMGMKRWLSYIKLYDSRKLKNYQDYGISGTFLESYIMQYQSDLCPSCHTTSACLLSRCLLTARSVMKHDIVWRTIRNERLTFCDTRCIKTTIIHFYVLGGSERTPPIVAQEHMFTDLS